MPIFRREVVGTSAKIIASYNPNRRVLLIINMGNAVVYISEDPVGVAENGIPVMPGTGISLDYADGDRPELAYFAQSTAEGQEIRIYEGIAG